MANAGELKVKISGDDKDLQESLSRSSRTVKNFSGLLSGVAIGAGLTIFNQISSALSDFLGGANDEFLEAQRSLNGLRQSLEAIDRQDLFTGLVDKAGDLQKSFKYLDNDDVVNSFEKLIQIGGLTEDQINRLIPVIIDLNAKQKLSGSVNKSVAQTTDDVIKGLSGSSRELKKYGIELTAAASQSDNLNTILRELPSKVEGASKAFGESLEGNLAATTQKVKDLQEEIGGKLLPMKVSLLNFAVEGAKAFENFFQQLNGTYEATLKTRNELIKLANSKRDANTFAEGLSDAIGGKTDNEFGKLVSFYDKKIDYLSKKLGDKLAANPGSTSTDFPELNEEIQKNRDLVDALKEKRRLLEDDRALGKNSGRDTVATAKKEVDAIKTRITALKELVAAGIDVSKNKFELKGLDIQLILRDARKNGFTQAEAERLIFSKYPEFEGGLKISKPLKISVPLEVSVEEATTGRDAAKDDLTQGIERSLGRLVESGQKAGAELRKRLGEPLFELNQDIKSIFTNTFIGIGEAIGDVLAGSASPVSAFVSIIADAVEQLGKALLAYGAATLAAKLAIKEGAALANPYIAIGAGLAAIAAGKILRSQLNKPVKFAEGGLVTGPTLGLVGEAGPELIVPLNRADQFLGGGGPVDISGEFTISGQNLVYILNRGQEALRKRGG